MTIANKMKDSGIVPVVVLDKAQDAVPCGKALKAGGIDIMEITMRTAAALDSIRLVSKELPEVCLGAGTVLTLQQCHQAVDAGAKFIVSPGFNQEVVKWCVKEGITVLPGCVTPTEIMQALELDINIIKFFPANVYGGLSAMKSLSGPFPNVKFVPTGGVSAKNLAEYASASFIHAIGGSWMCTGKDIAEGNFDKITTLSSEAIEIIAMTRVEN
jgi:2-dehydro-3-deoxyphosphogluconate aldolase/(4S)-4-hydroxy-2-oxoglutarate aldolase